MRWVISAIALIVAALVLGGLFPAKAQMVCGDRDEIVSILWSKHEEVKTATAMSGSGGQVELYTGQSQSWTLIMTLPGGPACLLGSGENWEEWDDHVAADTDWQLN